MSANISITSNSSLGSANTDCGNIAPTHILSSTIYGTKSVLLGSLCTFILYLAQQRWRQQRSFTAASHSDIFTYNLAVMELLGIFGVPFVLSESSSETTMTKEVGLSLISFPLSGENFFHILTCVERYLAVVHPHTYMGLKNARGIRLRNILVGCVWLLCFIWMVITNISGLQVPMIPLFAVMISSIIVISFCSLSVLCALIRPGPGEVGHGKERVDQSKKKAFFTITAILATQWLWFTSLFISFGIMSSKPKNHKVLCLAFLSVQLFNLPSSLVAPLLYLQRAGKLTFCLHRDGG